MKKLTKNLLTASLSLSLLLAGGTMFACNEKTELVLNDQIKTSAETIVANMADKVYNKLPGEVGKAYTVAEAKEEISDFTQYYVEIGTLKHVKEVNSITLGDVKFEKDQTISLSVGNSKTIKDKAYYVEDNKLFLAGPVVLFETANVNKITINDTEVDFNIQPAVATINYTKVDYLYSTTSTIEKVENKDNEYNAIIRQANYASLLGFYYEGATADDVVLTRRMANGRFNGYGLTDVEPETDYPLGCYFYNYVSDGNVDNVTASYDNVTWNYRAYIIGKGVANATVNVDIKYSTEE